MPTRAIHKPRPKPRSPPLAPGKQRAADNGRYRQKGPVSKRQTLAELADVRAGAKRLAELHKLLLAACGQPGSASDDG